MYVYASFCINRQEREHGAVGGTRLFGWTRHVGDRALAAREIWRPGPVFCRRRRTGAGRARRPGRKGQALRRRRLRRPGPPRRIRARLRVPHAPRRRRVRAHLSARHRHGATGHGRASRGTRAAARRAGLGPRLHRQGKRSGPLRAHLRRPRPRAPGHRAVARVAVQGPRGPHRLREGEGRAGPGDGRQAVFDRPQPVALLARRRHPGRPVERTPGTHLRHDARSARSARPCPGGGDRLRRRHARQREPRPHGAGGAARVAERHRGRARRGPGGCRGGPAGRDEIARCLRDAGRHAAVRGAPRARAAGARPAHAAPQGRAGAPLRRPGVRRSLVDAGAGGARRRGREHPEARDRRGAPEALQGRPHRRGPGKSLCPVPAFLRDVRQGQRLRSEGCRGIHPSLRPLDPDRIRTLGGAPPAGSRRGSGLMPRQPTDIPAPAPAPAPAPPPAPAHQMWGGRFTLGPSEALDALNRSLPVDHRLWPQDVAASKAWVHALGRVGVLTPAEESQLLEGLDRTAERLADGAAVGAPDEDVHTLVERLLYAEVGTVAGKLHTGRSRNDQVATDLRLWTLGAIDQVDSDLAALGRALVARAEGGVDVLLPGYTHGQRAQPVRWAYVLLAHAWPLVRDRQRLADARRRVAERPLGSGALAGSGFPVDRVLLKEALGFRAISANALDATGDRDFVAAVLFAIALVGTHLSRLGAELITYASGEYAFITLSDAFSTGSSLMPQKRNPDVFELARGKSGRMLGDLVALLTTLKGIPAGYQKDLQEDKALLFDACDTLATVLPAVTGAIDTLTVNIERMAAALDPAMRATDLADLLVEAGVPFRESHGLVGRLVREAERSGVPLDQVPSAVAAGIHPKLGAAVSQLGTWEDSVEGRATPGGSSRASVEAQLEELKRAFAAAEGL